MGYAIIKLSGKQYRVREGDHILVDRLGQEEGKTFHPDVLLYADDGKTELAPKAVQVTAKVVSHTLGEKIRVGKYRRRTGYKKHTGHRSRLSEVEIQKVAKKAATRKPAAKTEEKPVAKAEAKPPAAKKPAATRKPAAKKETE
jgi:large subunit ribosomal protein L21